MKNNKFSKAVVVFCVSIFLITGCFFNKDKESPKEKKTAKTTYKEDKTTEVLIDSELKKEDIVKIVKHGDHWHVFTKDGKEHITYQDPNKIGKEDLELVNVVDKNSIKDKSVVKILKHGDHWHVYTKDGGEYLTYENPQSIFPNIRVGKYEGSHYGSSNNSTSNIKDRVVQILSHGDHWHIYTSSGNEYISYQDPRGLYPNASYGIYKGSHGSVAKSKNHNQNSNLSSNTSNTIKDLDKLVKVENNKRLDNVVKIAKHGDHWHIYTKDGNESITYVDPQKKYKDIKIEEYEGSHKTTENKKPSKSPKENKKEKEDKQKTKKETQKDIRIEEIKKLKLVPILGKGEIDRFDIVKILVHNDHYHIFDSKGVEAITYKNPKDLFPKAYFGEYEEGKKEENKKDKVENKQEDKEKEKEESKKEDEKEDREEEPKEEKPKKETKEEKTIWPSGITLIVDHKDHWHLYRGDEEVGVVKENPKEIYHDAEYIVEKNENENIQVEDDEIFNYGDVRAELINGVIPYLDGDLSKFTNFGNLSDTDPVYGSNGVRENIFYWYHVNHYHAKTIKQIIQMEKEGKFGEYTAKDVVKTIKYKIENPDTDLEYVPEISVYEVKNYLKKYYDLDSSDLYTIGDSWVQVYLKNDTLNFHVRDFEKKDGRIVYKKEMPQIKKDMKKGEDAEDIEDEKIENIDKKENQKEKQINDNKIKDETSSKASENTEIKNKEDNKKEEVKKENKPKEEKENKENQAQ